MKAFYVTYLDKSGEKRRKVVKANNHTEAREQIADAAQILSVTMMWEVSE